MNNYPIINIPTATDLQPNNAANVAFVLTAVGSSAVPLNDIPNANGNLTNVNGY